MKFFDNIFDIQDNSSYCVTGLNSELVCINIYNTLYTPFFYLKKNWVLSIEDYHHWISDTYKNTRPSIHPQS